MKPLPLVEPGAKLSVLCLGAHSDDIEIGVGGTILGWIAAGVQLDVCWCVLSAQGPRREEAMAAAEAILEGAASAASSSRSFVTATSPIRATRSRAGSRTSSRTAIPTSCSRTARTTRTRTTARSRG